MLSLETQITRVNQLTRNIALTVIKTITLFQIVIKNNVTKNTKNIEIRDQELPNNLLYNTSVVNPAILKITELKIKLIILLEKLTVIDIVKTTPTIVIDIEIMIDTEATVEIIHKTTDTRQRYYKRSQSPYSSRSRYDNHYQRRTPSRSPYRSPYRTTLSTDIILDQDIDLALNHKEIPLDDIITHIDLDPNQEITDLEHLHRTDNKTESIK